ncbi:hypothetical protein C8R46DRAFT_666019 [Mycena filopes]|nr:hypothetical protein C8R46DRAFT_666019 [Mycena filopes]
MNDHAPIFSLPAELLAAIIAAAGQDDLSNFPHHFYGDQPEWTMSRVSRRFRAIALGTPSLWTLVQVDLISEGLVELFKLYLARSRGCKIWVTLREFSLARVGYSDIAERLEHLVPALGRVQRLGILSNPESMVAMLAPFQDVDEVPLLEYLELHTGNLNDSQTSGCFNCPANIFSLRTPKLTFVELSRFTPHLPVPRWTTTLTHLKLSYCEDVASVAGNSCLTAIATQCPLLIHLEIDTLSLSHQPHIPVGAIHIPSLKTLQLSVECEYDFDDMLSLLDTIALFNTPAVTDLIVGNAHDDDVSVLFDPASLPDTLFPAVTSLTFVGGRECPCDVKPSMRGPLGIPTPPPLHLFPALTSLALINRCCTVQLVEDLIGPESQPWPLLQTVTLCPMGNSLQEVLDVIRNAVRTKRQNGQTVPKFRVSRELYQRGGDFWQGNGVDVELFDPSPLVNGLDD